jgi:hypothetical protein
MKAKWNLVIIIGKMWLLRVVMSNCWCVQHNKTQSSTILEWVENFLGYGEEGYGHGWKKVSESGVGKMIWKYSTISK